MFFFPAKAKVSSPDWAAFWAFAWQAKDLPSFCHKFFDWLDPASKQKSYQLWLKQGQSAHLSLIYHTGPKPLSLEMPLQESLLQYMIQTGKNFSRQVLEQSPNLVDLRESAFKLFSQTGGSKLFGLRCGEDFLGIVSCLEEEGATTRLCPQELWLSLLASQVRFYDLSNTLQSMQSRQVSYQASRQKLFQDIAQHFEKPVENMSGLLEILLSEINQEHFLEKSKSYLPMLQDGVQELKEKISLALALEKIKSQEKDLVLESILLKPFLEGMAQDWQPRLQSLSLRLSLQIPKDLKVYGPLFKLKKIIECFLLNALEFSSGQGGELSIRAQAVGQESRFWLLDPGMDLGEEEEKKIIQALQKEETDSELSLALSLMKYLIHSQGAKLHLEMRPGQACEFSFSLPGSPSALY